MFFLFILFFLQSFNIYSSNGDDGDSVCLKIKPAVERFYDKHRAFIEEKHSSFCDCFNKVTLQILSNALCEKTDFKGKEEFFEKSMLQLFEDFCNEVLKKTERSVDSVLSLSNHKPEDRILIKRELYKDTVIQSLLLAVQEKQLSCKQTINSFVWTDESQASLQDIVFVHIEEDLKNYCKKVSDNVALQATAALEENKKNLLRQIHEFNKAISDKKEQCVDGSSKERESFLDESKELAKGLFLLVHACPVAELDTKSERFQSDYESQRDRFFKKIKNFENQEKDEKEKVAEQQSLEDQETSEEAAHSGAHILELSKQLISSGAEESQACSDDLPLASEQKTDKGNRRTNNPYSLTNPMGVKKITFK